MARPALAQLPQTTAWGRKPCIDLLLSCDVVVTVLDAVGGTVMSKADLPSAVMELSFPWVREMVCREINEAHYGL